MNKEISFIKVYGNQYINQSHPLFSDALSNVNLLLLGDSITQGSGATGLGNGIDFTTSLGTKKIWQTGNSWALKLKSYLQEQYPNITLTNHGWGGITLEQLSNKISEFVPNNTTHCIIGLGVNSGGSESFDTPVASIINYLKEKNIQIFAWTSWLGTHPNLQNINTPGRIQAALIHAYNAVGISPLPVYSIAKKYIDDNNISFDDVMEYQPNNEIVHPNDLGHDILYKIIREGFGF